MNEKPGRLRNPAEKRGIPDFGRTIPSTPSRESMSAIPRSDPRTNTAVARASASVTDEATIVADIIDRTGWPFFGLRI